jgi:hypothetical protein
MPDQSSASSDALCERAGTDESTIQAFQREIEMMTVVGKHPAVIEIVGQSALLFARPETLGHREREGRRDCVEACMARAAEMGWLGG